MIGLALNPNLRITAANGKLVVVVSEGRAFAEETEANARLIAAAPDLFKTLERLRSTLRLILEDEIAQGGIDGTQSLQDDLQFAEAALQKARGL